MLRSAELLQRIQQQALHQVVRRQQWLAGKLQPPSDRAALWSLPSDVWRVELDGLAQLGQRMVAAALTAQFEVAGCAADWLETESDCLAALASPGEPGSA